MKDFLKAKKLNLIYVVIVKLNLKRVILVIWLLLNLKEKLNFYESIDDK